jgi:hypothetical protein
MREKWLIDLYGQGGDMGIWDKDEKQKQQQCILKTNKQTYHSNLRPSASSLTKLVNNNNITTYINGADSGKGCNDHDDEE